MLASSECNRIADQLRQAFSGDPWHGAPLLELLNGITAEQAFEHPLPSAHSIGELVIHIDLYVQAAIGAVRGIAMPKWYGTEQDWPDIEDEGDVSWKAMTDAMFRNAAELANAIEQWSDDRLLTTVPGREYSFYYLFHAVIQHSLYHGGQIAMLKKIAARS